MKAERVYLSFLADPWAIMFYDFFSGVRRQFVFDGPRGPVKELSPGAAVVLNRAERPRDLERRFGIKLVPVAETAGHLVFRAAER